MSRKVERTNVFTLVDSPKLLECQRSEIGHRFWKVSGQGSDQLVDGKKVGNEQGYGVLNVR